MELTVDDFWHIADAGDQELWRLAHSSRRGTLELGAEDNDGLYSKLVLHSLRNKQVGQVVMHHAHISGSLLPDVLKMLQLVHDPLRRGIQNRVATVDARCDRDVD